MEEIEFNFRFSDTHLPFEHFTLHSIDDTKRLVHIREVQPAALIHAFGYHPIIEFLREQTCSHGWLRPAF